MRAALLLPLVLVLSILGLATSGGPAGATKIIVDVVSPGPATGKPSLVRYREGVDALARGDLVSAEVAFEESRRLDPAWYGPLLGLADVAIRDGQPQQAETWLDQAETMAPGSVEVLTARGRFHFIRGELEAAESAYQRAIAADEGALLPRLDLADLYLKDLWKPRDAIEAYSVVLKREPDHAGAHYGRGVGFMATGRPDAAMQEFASAIALAPDNPLPHLALGRLHLSRGDYGDAVAAFTQALEVKPESATAHLDRGDAHAALGDYEAAIADYEAATEIAPNLGMAQFRLGSLYQALQRWDAAESAYLAAVRSDPTNAAAFNNLAWIAAERKTRLDEALTWAQRAVELSPGTVAFQDTLGWVYRARGDLAKAAEVLEEAATAGARFPDAAYHLGIVYSEQGRRAEAIAALRKALDIDNDFAEAVDARRRIDSLSGG